MPIDGVYRDLRSALSGEVRADEPMRRHTTFRIGGPAAYFVTCDSVSDLARATAILGEADVEWTVLGRGSNVLVSDEGWPGAVLVLGRDFRRHTVEDDHLQAGAGVVLGALVQEAYSRALSGLEFAVGIPGTFGGALAMNAGSRDRWIGSVVESVSLFVPGTGLVAVRGPEVDWRYRGSDLASRGIIVEAVLRVQQAESEAIRYAMDGSLRRRRITQPIGAACAGSVFVNPEGDSAGRLIEAAGLKGARVGHAIVSAVHANFIINEGGATAADVVALVRRVMATVKDMYDIDLRPEIRFLGAFESA
jgi:UDP-N-acetylmuramate dehydrogenase